MSIKDVEPTVLIKTMAGKMEKMKEFQPPEWSKFVKTGVSRQRPPIQKNWWFLRSASILRKVYLEPGVGVNRLSKVYGGRKNRGHKPEHKAVGSTKIIRTSIQQLEKAGLLEAKVEKKKNVGRKISKKGLDFIKDAEKNPLNKNRGG